jgi:hypothetical protein
MLSAVAYNMLADVYTKTRTRQPSGNWLEEWNYDNPTTIKCLARYVPIEGFSASAREVFNELALDQAYVHVRTAEKIAGGEDIRIGNIRKVDRYGRAVYPIVDNDGDPSIFIVTGEVSKMEPWSNIIEWHYLLELPES